MHSFVIKKIAVLGSGVMGAQIAAHCVNAGIETLLYDLASNTPSKNELINKALANLSKLKPAPLGTPQITSLIQPKNYEENLDELRQCDLIIEAIAERMDLKTKLYELISPFIHENAVLATNTSGLSINRLCQILPASLQPRFCGIHFFNPPRYMHLAEMIPADTTRPDLLDQIETWLTRFMGKGVVRAKDTPNFIANRIGVFSLLITLYHAEQMGIGLDEVDALTGPLIGRPKSATFRTMDVVGLDTMSHVVKTMWQQLEQDPWHSFFQLPNWLNELINKGHLGQKTGQGIYRKKGKAIEVYDLSNHDYRFAKPEVSSAIKEMLSNPDPKARMDALLASDNKHAKFLAACFRDLFHYTAYHLEEIAHSVSDVDLALRWGFGWHQGLFEIWQQAGVKTLLTFIEKNNPTPEMKLPNWLTTDTRFYSEEGAFSPNQSRYIQRKSFPVYKRQLFDEKLLDEKSLKLPVIYENAGVKLCHFKDDIGILSFKSKANTIGQDVLEGLENALDKANQQCQGIVIYQNDANNFSSGADLRSVGDYLERGELQHVESMIANFQRLVMRIKYSSIPIVSALRGRALGGGCELILHCSAIVAAFESYPGLVEVGVGLIPAGGGCKEMALRAAEKSDNLMSVLQRYFQQIATATVAESAPDALLKGYLRPQDTWVMHADEVLYAAVAKVNYLNATNYLPPIPQCFKVAGREGHALLQAGLINWLEGGFISQHDYLMANKLAFVMCGGDLYQGELVDEEWLLQLEKQAFMELAATPLTQQRISSLLQTGKPLRN